MRYSAGFVWGNRKVVFVLYYLFVCLVGLHNLCKCELCKLNGFRVEESL